MMEAKPVPGLPAVATHSTRPSAQGAEQPAEGADNFEQQLSHQLDQTSAASNTENSNNNQLHDGGMAGVDADSSAASESAEILIGANPDLPLTADAVALDLTDTAPQVLASPRLTAEHGPSLVTDPLDQTLPLAGNVLPPLEVPLPVAEQPVLSQFALDTGVSVKVSSQTTANTAVIQSPPELIKARQMQPDLNNSVVQAELSDKPVSFQELDIIKANNGNQESNQQMNQSRSGISMASSVAAAASQLQQVPLTTASAHLNLAATVIPVDSMLSLGINQASQGIASPVQSQAWSQGLTEQVSWMVRGNIQSAKIKLNPANLGPLEVKLSIEDDVARLSFVSSHAPVREALDAAMPRLKEMLEQQGISLGDVDVSQHSEQGQQSADESADSTGMVGQSESNTESPDLVEDLAGVKRITINDGLSIYA
ncbi:MAG: flagellar hook-length control protein FliK [Gammaproteobacteria bacterium]